VTPSSEIPGESARIVACIPRLRRYARALVGSGRAGDADDLVQDTLERAFARLHQWRRQGDPRVWLFSIMHNRFIDQRRTRQPAPGDRGGDRAPELAVPAADGLVLHDLAAALAQLPGPQREVLLLVTLEQLSYAEVAASLGVPVGTVMSRLSRGREALRAIMEGRSPPASLRVVE
jgi:RNA polymerase sigma-70 factor (ECF subfamily)